MRIATRRLALTLCATLTQSISSVSSTIFTFKLVSLYIKILNAAIKNILMEKKEERRLFEEAWRKLIEKITEPKGKEQKS